MTTNIVQAAYIVSAVLFVLSLHGLSKHEKAKEGNAFGVTGMVIAPRPSGWPLSAPRTRSSPCCSSPSPWSSGPASACGGRASSR